MSSMPTTPASLRTTHPDDQCSVDLFNAIQAEDPDQLRRVFEGAARVELEPEFLGFVEIYKRLAEAIPRHWGVLDLGCAYAPQAWYFREHAFYIGVDFAGQTEFGPTTRFAFGNTQHVESSIDVYLDTRPTFTAPVFAIMNYVPAPAATVRRVRETFENLFVFYPKGSLKAPPGLVSSR